jgi:hypothetical protein
MHHFPIRHVSVSANWFTATLCSQVELKLRRLLPLRIQMRLNGTYNRHHKELWDIQRAMTWSEGKLEESWIFCDEFWRVTWSHDVALEWCYALAYRQIPDLDCHNLIPTQGSLHCMTKPDPMTMVLECWYALACCWIPDLDCVIIS